MKAVKFAVFLLFLSIVFTACSVGTTTISIQKRKHLKGHYIQFLKNSKQEFPKAAKPVRVSLHDEFRGNAELNELISQLPKPVEQQHLQEAKQEPTEIHIEQLPIKPQLFGLRNLGSTQILNTINQRKKQLYNAIEEPPKPFAWYSILVFLLGFLSGVAVALFVLALSILIPFLGVGFDWFEVQKPSDFTVKNTFNWAFLIGVNTMITAITIVSVAAILIAFYMAYGLAGLILAILATVLLMFVLAKIFNAALQRLMPLFFIGWGR